MLFLLSVHRNTSQNLFHQIDESISFHFLVANLSQCPQKFFIASCLELDLFKDFDENSIQTPSHIFDYFENILLKLVIFGQDCFLTLLDGLLDRFGININRGHLIQILLRIVDDQLEGFYFMTTMFFIIADPTNHTLLNALGLDTDQTQGFSDMEFPFLALRVLEHLRWRCTHRMIFPKNIQIILIIPSFLIKSLHPSSNKNSSDSIQEQCMIKIISKQKQVQIDCTFALKHSFITYLLRPNNKPMCDTTSEISIPDHKSENIMASEQFSLPMINQKPSSRGEATFKNKAIKTHKLLLPNINDQQQKNQQEDELEKKSEEHQEVENSHSKAEMMRKSKFALDVEEKLKMVLGGMQEEAPVEEGDSIDSDDFDFEAKINANKELIKMHRLKKQNQNQQTQQNNKIQVSNPPKPKKITRPKVQSLYEKRVREYRDQSVENKYLQKRKQTIKQKSNSPMNQVRESLRQIKPKDYVSAKQNMKKHTFSTKKVYPRAPSQKSLKQQSQKANKSINLFDGIQNYLENPRQNKEIKNKNGEKPLVGLSLLKAKRDIEDKIKAINEKLGVENELDEKSLGITSVSNGEENKITHQTVRNWRKIEIKQRKIKLHQSNFDKQLDRINSLQEHNSHSLQKFLEHQKIILELELRKRGLARETNTH